MGHPAMALPYAGHPGRSVALADRLLNCVLFITILTSSIAFIEPSPHDALIFVLLAACIVARIPFDRKLAPLLALMVLWLVGGAMSLIQVDGDQEAIQYFGTSVYLDLACVMFACLFSDGNLVRLSIMRRAYLLAALIAVVAGYIGFFHLLPGSDMFLDIGPDGSTGTLAERVSATFKDPNVYGPFLVFPLLLLMLGFLRHRVTLTGIAVTFALLGGLFLSFSRGAWVHFVLSALVAVALAYAAAPNPRMRARIVAFGLLGIVAVGLLLIAMNSIGSIHDLFIERAKAIQPYDVGPGGRFTEQKRALNVILENPNGLGPFGFANTYGLQQHNVYLQGFLVYGWLGGTVYFTLIALTFLIGLRCVLWPTPWQIYLIAAYAAYIGEIGEGTIIDTDHWRHFFLLVGLVWGLSVASINWRRPQAGQLLPA
jgi:O-Antigen ligase